MLFTLAAAAESGDALSVITSGKLDSITIVGFATLGMLFGLFWGLIGAFLGSFKNRKTLGLFLGMVLGIVGLIPLLFAKDGDREEGFSDMFMALIMSAVVNVAMVSLIWFTIAKPMMIDIAKDAKRADELHAQRMAAINAPSPYYPPATAPAPSTISIPATYATAPARPTPKPKPTPASVTWSAFPPGVDTPEERRAYLQQLADAKREREGDAR